MAGEQVDLLVGIIVHEALHRIEWSDHVWKLLEPAMAKLPPLHRAFFKKLSGPEKTFISI
ncbi:MAG: hypothetical protein R2861_05760 [Desulfobacterales bacterium]